MTNFTYLNQNVFNPNLEARPLPLWLADQENTTHLPPGRANLANRAHLLPIPWLANPHTPAYLPPWRAALQKKPDFPLKPILTNSLFYPASGVDDRPVQYLCGHIHSFVYADCGVDRADLIEAQPYKGYDVERRDDVRMEELYPNGREPLQLIPQDTAGCDLERAMENWKPFFAIWTIYRRRHDLNDDHGPERFSLLFICDDGPTVFHNLYKRQNCSPDCLAIIQPGTGFGCNWTDFRNTARILGREVLQNPFGVPNYLLQDVPEKTGWSPPFDFRVGNWNEGFSLWERP